MDFPSKESMIGINMTTKQAKKLERIANESMKYARKALAKSNEIHAILSLMEAKAGKVKSFTSAAALFKRLKI